MEAKLQGSGEEPQLWTAVPFTSMIGAGFWNKFTEVVLDEVQLSRKKIPIWGYYSKSIAPNMFTVDYSSFNETPKREMDTCVTSGCVINTNTVDEFLQKDKNALIQAEAQELVKLLSSDDGLKQIEANPSLMVPFFLLAYGNLKNYRFKYWFGFPAISTIKLRIGERSAQPAFDENVLNQEIQRQETLMSSGFFVVDTRSSKLEIKPLADGAIEDGLYYGFNDTSSLANHPSWILRNFVAYIVSKHKCPSGSTIHLVGLNRWRSKIHSQVYSISVEYPEDYLTSTKIVGWERNDDGKLCSRDVDLQSSLDPASLAESSIDLNLKLMKWRVFPELRLDKIKNTKCLLFGAGTLGCNVARCLLGWGVRHIKFIDNSCVSYSNPVRQSLFTFEDCIQKKPKAVAAAEALKKIYPGVQASGEKLMVPMPGHPVSPATIKQVKSDFEAVKKSIEESDVVFLLLDTREARWLPSVISAAAGKIVINAALGFDSYVVMQHGNEENNLGCYFCTDVVAPGDSTRDRTLDQQCTVTRPGVSFLAAAYAVELLVNMLHADLSSSPLGKIPHSIRGFLSSNDLMTPKFTAFDKCTACSTKVLEEYRARGIDFVMEVMNDPDKLEVLTGLDQLKLSDAIDGIIALTDEEDDDE